METFNELVKDEKFTENLMANKNFVEDAKRIFKSENIEIDDKKLTDLLKEIEFGLKIEGVLDDKSLEEISGGGILKFTARNVIKITTTVVGAFTGEALVGTIGVGSGAGIGGAIGGGVAGLPGAGAGAVAGGIVGGGGVGLLSGYIGYKIGKAICKAIDLE